MVLALNCSLEVPLNSCSRPCWVGFQPLLILVSSLSLLANFSLHQLHQSQLELQEVRLSYRQLQVKMEELNEERSLQGFNSTRMSLLSEIEQSMEAEELEQEREQVRSARRCAKVGQFLLGP